MKKAPRPADVEIGARIKRFRTIRDMSQETLAAACNVTFQQIQKYEKGTNRVSGSRLIEIAAAFKIDPRDLLPASGEGIDPVPMFSPIALSAARLIDSVDEERRSKLVQALRHMAEALTI